MYFLGLDIGSSSVKLALFDGEQGVAIGSIQEPAEEFSIEAPESGWAEQHPDLWWNAISESIGKLLAQFPEAKKKIASIGISYQMHGLVAVDKNGEPVYPSIIWCDSRATETGNQLFDELGDDWCMQNLLNSPGNFTFSKLKWIADNKQDVFARIDKVMLPGDYIAYKLTGEISSTATGLSEGILWNFKENRAATELFEQTDISQSMLPPLVDCFGSDLKISEQAAHQFGLSKQVTISYRAGDQPNNAFSLNVLEDGEFATTAGTSGVVYAVTDKNIADKNQRINSFLHVNHLSDQHQVGLLACINGAGRLNSWLKHLLSATGQDVSYPDLNKFAEQSCIGSLGALVHPFGNGAERILQNKLLSGQFIGLDFNRHGLPHICRAVQEGVAFSMALGMKLIYRMGVASKIVRAGHANMFLSDVFSEAFVNTTETPLELFDTNGAEGAARGAAWASGFYSNRADAFASLKKLKTLEPTPEKISAYGDVYGKWHSAFEELSKQQ